MRKQHGVLRTNCIDCLDRTNVAQFAAGLSALGRQLVGLGLAAQPDLDPRSSAASHLMSMYESMGNTLARQVCHLHLWHRRNVNPCRTKTFQSVTVIGPCLGQELASVVCKS